MLRLLVPGTPVQTMMPQRLSHSRFTTTPAENGGAWQCP